MEVGKAGGQRGKPRSFVSMDGLRGSLDVCPCSAEVLLDLTDCIHGRVGFAESE
jgi:hypothetical protein